MDIKTFENTEEGLILRLKIVPNSSKNQIIFDGKILKIKVTALPIENKANKALVEFLAKKLHCAKSSIQILKGDLNKEKTLFIANFNEQDFIKKIEI